MERNSSKDTTSSLAAMAAKNGINRATTMANIHQNHHSTRNEIKEAPKFSMESSKEASASNKGDNDNNSNNEIHVAAHPQHQQEDSPPENPLQIPQKLPSKESLQGSIARWEALLACSCCGTLQESLATLWEHPQFERPICSLCCRSVHTDPTPSKRGLQQPSTSARPLSELLRCRQKSEREESVRGPAILLEAMKRLLEHMESEEKEGNIGDKQIEEGSLEERGGQQEKSSEKATTDPALAQQEKAAEQSNASPPPSQNHKYASLNPGFFGTTLETAANDKEHELHDQGFRYRESGGEVYDPALRRKSKATPKKEEEESDGAFDFPDSQTNSLQQETQSTQDTHQEKEPVLSQSSQPAEAPLQEPQAEDDDIAQDHSSQSEPTNPAASSPTLGGDALAGSSSLEQDIEPTHASELAPQSQNDSHKSTLGGLIAELLPENGSTTLPADLQGLPGADYEDTQRTMESIATQDLPQTADFENFGTFAVAKPTEETGNAHDTLDSGLVDSQELPQSINTDAPPLQQAATIAKQGNLKVDGENVGDSQEPPQSIATQELPQTCDFEQFSQSQPLAQSIDSVALPQTADFREPLWNGHQNGSHEGVEQHGSQENAEKAAHENGNDENFDSQPKSIDTQMLPQTADFEYDMPIESNQNPAEESMNERQENDPNCGNSPRTSVTAGGEGDGKEPTTSIFTHLETKTSDDGLLHISKAAKTPGAEDSQSTSRRITPPSVSLSQRAKTRSDLTTIVIHEEPSFEDRGLLKSLQDNGTCIVDDLKGAIPIASIHDSVSQREKRTLIFNADLLETKKIQGLNQEDSGLVSVCLQSFPYLLARVMGWRLMSSECLGALQRGATSLDEYSIWGDVQLYKAVSAHHDQYAWHESSKWWNSLHLSPCDSSVERHQGTEEALFANLHIIVCKMDVQEEKACLDDDCAIALSFDRSGEGPFAESGVEYKSLTGDQIESLVLAGCAKVLQSITNEEEHTIVVIPDTLDDEEGFVRKMIESGVLRGMTETSNVSFVYYSWIIDSICADCLAPLDIYQPDFCSQE